MGQQDEAKFAPHDEIDPKRQPDRPRLPYEKNWPDDVWSVGLHRIDLLGVDDDGNLYWNGKRIEVRRPLSLSFWQKTGAVAVTISAVVGAGAAAVSAYADLVN